MRSQEKLPAVFSCESWASTVVSLTSALRSRAAALRSEFQLWGLGLQLWGLGLQLWNLGLQSVVWTIEYRWRLKSPSARLVYTYIYIYTYTYTYTCVYLHISKKFCLATLTTAYHHPCSCTTQNHPNSLKTTKITKEQLSWPPVASGWPQLGSRWPRIGSK